MRSHLFANNMPAKSLHMSYLFCAMAICSYGVEIVAQTCEPGFHGRHIVNAVVVHRPAQEAWEALAEFGHVSVKHSLIDESLPLNAIGEYAVLEAEREIHIPDGRTNIIWTERVISLVPGSHYTAEVLAREHIPLKQMQITYGVRKGASGQTILYNKMQYRMSFALLSGILRSKMEPISMDSPLSNKYYLEAGITESEQKELEKSTGKSQRKANTARRCSPGSFGKGCAIRLHPKRPGKPANATRLLTRYKYCKT